MSIQTECAPPHPYCQRFPVRGILQLVEKKPGKVPTVGEYRLKKQNEAKRKGLELTPSGDLLYPEEKGEMTYEEAYDLAKKILEQFPDERRLFEDFKARESANTRRSPFSSPTDLTDKSLHREMIRTLADNRYLAGTMGVPLIVRKLEAYQQAPRAYRGVDLVAMAEVLYNRLGPAKK
jgi:hypothetical protein